MKRVFIGHRGVGKSALLERHKCYYPQIKHFDLDHEIENKTQTPIKEIFTQKGEASFRQIETETLSNLLRQSSNFVIALGAGCDLSVIPTDVEVIYVSRKTDKDGRIFRNRPRLNSDLSALEESILRFEQRDTLYRRRASWIYHMPEGVSSIDDTEKQVLETKDIQAGYATVSTPHFESYQRFHQIELRTDLLSQGQIKDFVKRYPNKQILISHRVPVSSINPECAQFAMDWAVELGSVPEFINPQIISVHEGSVTEAISQLSKYSGVHLKLAPIVKSWADLKSGHKWWSEDPANRSFLPRTEMTEAHSRWQWYRQLMLPKQKINFVQTNLDFEDQPTIYDVFLAQRLGPQSVFSAVLGNPVHHSFTPYFHQSRFGFPVLAIPLRNEDWSIAIEILQSLGLICAAITSPLKETAADYFKADKPVNSVVFQTRAAISTDQLGFRALKGDVSSPVAIWGGGGVLPTVMSEIPYLTAYSARSGQIKLGAPLTHIHTLIWAAPRGQDILFPSENLKPQKIVDINYTENSMGLEYAALNNIDYISGHKMFYAQAEEQVRFFKKELGL